MIYYNNRANIYLCTYVRYYYINETGLFQFNYKQYRFYINNYIS